VFFASTLQARPGRGRSGLGGWGHKWN
jgi:hypothetical protein